MKSIITSNEDKIRLAYRRDAQSFPRTFVFVGTTNDANPLHNDITGLRRFIITELHKKLSDKQLVSHLKAHREQLLAEAVHKFNKRESARLPEHLWEISSQLAEENKGGDLAFEQFFKEYLYGKSDQLDTPRIEVNIPDALKILKMKKK